MVREMTAHAHRGKAWLDRLADFGGKPWAVPVGLLGAILLTYGVFVPWLGFYWDDWPTAWFNILQGPGLYWRVFSSVRPFLPWLYSLTTPFLGVSPPAWQSFVVLTRWLAACGAWWMIRTTWTDRRQVALLAALLLGLYPGFKQTPVAIIYSHFFLLFFLSFVSLGLSVVAVRSPERKGLLLPAALGLEVLSIFSIEYTAGLELVRPLLLWIACKREGEAPRRRLRTTLLHWSPYALVFLGYLLWRTLGLGFPTYPPSLLEGIRTDALQAMADMLRLVGRALWTATAEAWAQVANFPALSEVGRRYMLGFLAIVAAVGMWSLLCILAVRGDAASNRPRVSIAEGSPMVILGLAAMVGGGLPIWVTQLPVGVNYPWDRLTLPLMLGAVFVMVGILAMIRPAGLRLGIAVGLLALSAGVHYRSTMTYVREGQRLGTFLWQLSWRIPALENGTTVVTNDIPLTYYSDNSLTAPLNWMYSPDNHTLQMDYMLYFPTVRVGLALSEPRPGLPIHQAYQAAAFDGTTSRMLALQYAPPGCVHVLDVIYDDSMPNLPPTLSAWVPLSRLDLIRTEVEAGPVPPLYPSEPAHDWCYFFEKADLARQRGDWQAVARLGDEGFEVDHPNDPSERLVFIEGYAHVGRWDRAEELSYAALEQNPAVDRMVCHTWDRILDEISPDAEGVAAAQRVRTTAACDAD